MALVVSGRCCARGGALSGVEEARPVFDAEVCVLSGGGKGCVNGEIAEILLIVETGRDNRWVAFGVAYWSD